MAGRREEGYLATADATYDTIKIPVTFLPSSVGTHSAVLKITSDADAGVLSIPLVGVCEVDAPVTRETRHEALAEARIMQQFKNAEKMKATLRYIGRRAQNFENAAMKLFAMLDIDAMTGSALNVIGAIVGLPREGDLSDADYRQMIRSKIAENSSQGSLPDIVEICRLHLGNTGDLLVAEVYPAEVEIFTSETDADWTALASALDAALPVGVRLGGIKPIVSDAFGFYEDDTAKGFDDGGLVDDYYEGE